MERGKKNKDMGKREKKDKKAKFYSAYCPVCGYERLLEKGKRASCPEHHRLLLPKGL